MKTAQHCGVTARRSGPRCCSATCRWHTCTCLLQLRCSLVTVSCCRKLLTDLNAAYTRKLLADTLNVRHRFWAVPTQDHPCIVMLSNAALLQAVQKDLNHNTPAVQPALTEQGLQRTHNLYTTPVRPTARTTNSEPTVPRSTQCISNPYNQSGDLQTHLRCCWCSEQRAHPHHPCMASICITPCACSCCPRHGLCWLRLLLALLDCLAALLMLLLQAPRLHVQQNNRAAPAC